MKAKLSRITQHQKNKAIDRHLQEMQVFSLWGVTLLSS